MAYDSAYEEYQPPPPQPADKIEVKPKSVWKPLTPASDDEEGSSSPEGSAESGDGTPRGDEPPRSTAGSSMGDTGLHPIAGTGGPGRLALPPDFQIAGVLVSAAGGDSPGAVHVLSADHNTLGRDHDCDVVVGLDDPAVSSQHGHLYIEKDNTRYIDCSTNGTRVDGEVVRGNLAPLKHGSLIELSEDLRLILLLVPDDLLGS